MSWFWKTQKEKLEEKAINEYNRKLNTEDPGLQAKFCNAQMQDDFAQFLEELKGGAK